MAIGLRHPGSATRGQSTGRSGRPTGGTTAIEFLDSGIQCLPFRVDFIQTDNSAEFQSAFRWHVLDKGTFCACSGAPILVGQARHTPPEDDLGFLRQGRSRIVQQRVGEQHRTEDVYRRAPRAGVAEEEAVRDGCTRADP
ncbi:MULTISPECIES: hypothetical protein [unclassified Streptomyces]|uniref:hypothetical protein n=1 Tax=unclassified Streptomyces TaxID=2593676 RepID=UPI0036F1437F